MSIVPVMALVTVLLAAVGPAHGRSCAEVPVAAQSGDFDGDGRPDRVWKQRVGKDLGGRVRAYDPWRGQLRAVEQGRPALVVAWGRPVVAGGACTLIQNRRFLSTPIWDEAPPPLAVLPRSALPESAFKGVQSRRWRGDGILLGTEAGIDILLYWDGRRFRIAYSGEQP